jgi:hypothetical protein
MHAVALIIACSGYPVDSAHGAPWPSPEGGSVSARLNNVVAYQQALTSLVA